MSQDLESLMVEWYEDNLSLREIGSRIGKDHHWVKRRLEKNGVVVVGNNKKPPGKDYICPVCNKEFFKNVHKKSQAIYCSLPCAYKGRTRTLVKRIITIPPNIKRCTKEELNKKQREYYYKNKERILENQKRYRDNNPEKEKLRYKKYAENNPEKEKLRAKKYRENNKDVRRTSIRKYYEKNKVSISISSGIRNSLKDGKGGRHWEEFVDFNIKELKYHLEKQFEDWMNWENHGLYNSNKKTWQIDHIIPVTFFKFEYTTDQEFKECWCLENLRPLSAKENISKNNTITKEIFNKFENKINTILERRK